MKSGMVKESMEPTLGPNMKHFDEFISQHEDNGHKHHSKEYAKHSAGHKVNHDHVKSIGKG
jgi:hypothetical protein